MLSFYAYFSVILILGYILIVSVYVEYQREKNKRKNFLTKQNIHTLKAETDEILAILVPKFVLEKLSFQSTSLAQEESDVSILFADICDFDDVMKEEKYKIVQHLEILFRSFDKLCI